MGICESAEEFELRRKLGQQWVQEQLERYRKQIQQELEQQRQQELQQQQQKQKHYLEYCANKTFTDADVSVDLIKHQEFICPITCEVFENPVFFGGHFYEADDLEKWFVSSGNRSSPMTRKTYNADGSLLEKILAPSYVIAQLEQFKSHQL
jgi:U-box domain